MLAYTVLQPVEQKEIYIIQDLKYPKARIFLVRLYIVHLKTTIKIKSLMRNSQSKETILFLKYTLFKINFYFRKICKNYYKYIKIIINLKYLKLLNCNICESFSLLAKNLK